MISPMQHYDAVIVGAGSMGMAAGSFLARQGVKTLLVDAFDPPHDKGSHHGDTRIIRHAYGEGRQYVPLALRAHQLWNELEQASGQRLLHQTGVLSVASAGSPFLDETIASAKEFSLPIQIMDAHEIQRNWPGITVPEDFTGCFETSSGVLFSEDCIRAYRKLAVDYGARVLVNTAVTDLVIEQHGAIIKTDEAAFTADKLIVCAGAWTGGIMSAIGLPLQPMRKTVAWFEAEEALFQSQKFPAFLFTLAEEQYYGFPSFNGSGVKIGRHDAGQPVDPEQPLLPFGSLPEDEGGMRHFLQTFMPKAAGVLKQGRVCKYTLTPDEHFIIDQHPNYSHVIIASGFSGHGFKFASVVGEILSQLVLHGKTEQDISCFSISRPAVQQPLSWL